MRSSSKKPIINENIEAETVRLVGVEGEQLGIVSIEEAREAAAAIKHDLVLIAPDAEPVVCKLMDYGKHIFELKKQKAASKKKQRRTQVKEIKFRPGTEVGDYQVKLRNLTRFLEDGDKAKVSLRFRGREMAITCARHSLRIRRTGRCLSVLKVLLCKLADSALILKVSVRFA